MSGLLIAAMSLTFAVADEAAELPASPTQAISLTYAEERRKDGISALELWLVAHPEDRAARLALARALSWSGSYDAALAHYDRLLPGADGAERRTLAIERAQVLAWKGRFRPALQGYRALLVQDPEDVDARLGLARTLRWIGRPLAARGHARRALARAPEREDAREELAWSYAQVGQRAATGRVLEEVTPSRELRRHLTLLAKSRLATAAAGSGNSFGIYRTAPRVRARILLPGDVTLEPSAGASYMQQGETSRAYGVAGVAASVAIDRVEVAVGAGIYAGSSYVAADAHARVAVQVADPLRLAVAYRRRPFVEAALPGAVDEAGFHGAGLGGAQLLDETAPLDVDQLSATINLTPGRWAYVYGDGTYVWVSDQNRGFAVSSGFGVDALGFGRTLPVGLLARWDTYLVGYDAARAAYYAPTLLDVHSVGPELRVRAWKIDLAAGGGATFPLVVTGAKGWFTGGALGLRTRRITAALRGDYRADAYFEQWRAWIALDIAL